VTEIGDYAFCRCVSLEQIDIPNSVTKIGKCVFKGCLLESIYSASEKTDDIVTDEDAFGGINLDDCILFVPSGTRWAYKHHNGFGQFKNIEINKKKSN
jgi:hypothetical protein